MPLPVLSPLTPDDLDAVMALERSCFADPWTRRMYLLDLTTNPMATYLALRPPAGMVGRPIPLSRAKQREAPPPDRATGEFGGTTVTQAAEIVLPPILAWGGFWLMVDEAHIATVASHPAWRGCGLGQWLVIALMKAAQTRGARVVTLEVRASNLPAQKLYEKLGFEITGYRRRYYRDGEDGLIMTTPLLTEPVLQARLTAADAEARTRAAVCFGDD